MRKMFEAIALGCICALSHASENKPLAFDQHIANCENTWFGAERTDGRIALGYVYIDPSQGFTFEDYGYLDESSGSLRAIPSDLHGKARVIVRIGENFPAVCLTESQVAALGLPPSPESMKAYRDDRPPGQHHARWAYYYNHIGASDIALDHVTKAIAAGESSISLTFEHAYALNALERFDETISLLTPVVASAVKTSDLIAELAYAFLKRGDYRKAIDLYSQALDYDQEKPSQRRWEFASNIAAAYEHLGDTQNRDRWATLSDQYRNAGEAAQVGLSPPQDDVGSTR